MKILMVNKFLYPRGGAESYMLKIGAYLAAQGHQIEYFGMYDSQNTVFNHAGVYTSNMDFRKRSFAQLLYPFRILYSLEAKKKIAAVLDDFQPDVVHMNNINFQLTPSIIDEIKSRGIPLIQTVHDYQMICPNHLLYNFNRKEICEKCIHGSKWNCVKGKCIHNSLPKSILGWLEALLYRARGTYRKVDRYICPSYFLERKLLEADGLFQGKTTVIHNYIELPELNAQQIWKNKKNYVVFAGRLDFEKGILPLAKAASLLPDVTFKVAGSGPQRQVLEGIPNLHLTGFLTGDALTQLISHAALSVAPSIWYENCPISILESISLGTPVLSVNAGGMAELVQPGITGELISPITGENLAKKIEKMLTQPDKLQEMSQNCIKIRDSFLTLEQYCQQLMEIYQDVSNDVKGRDAI